MHNSEKTKYLSQLIQHEYILWPHLPEGMMKSKYPIYRLYRKHDSYFPEPCMKMGAFFPFND